MVAIAFDGCIGAGKTTLAAGVAAELNLPTVLEDYSKHPFLQDFSRDVGTYGLETELVFLLMHFHELKKAESFHRELVADFCLSKALLYAKMNLSDGDIELHAALYNSLLNRIPQPRLTVYIEADTPFLWKRVVNRRRDWEIRLGTEYVDTLNALYKEYYSSKDETGTLRIRADEFEITDDPSALKRLCDLIERRL